MRIEIPKKLERKLAACSYASAVQQVLQDFAPWMSDRRLPFFPEFTDHSVAHIGRVIATAWELIPAAAMRRFTAEDAACLVLASLLHDSAMHITEDQFVAQVEEAPPARRGAPFLDGHRDPPWSRLWADFLREASRFDGRHLLQVLGTGTPDDWPPVGDAATISRRLPRVVGEFLRRHHGRLAHEFAVFGVPGPTAERLGLAGLPEEVRDAVGLVARSHTIPLRDAIEGLRDGTSGQHAMWRGMHLPFVMALLRLADYLDVDPTRAPKTLDLVRRLRSPLSELEWRKHFAIREVKTDQRDPESLWVEAEPDDARTWLATRRFLAELQRELDGCWAALGEVYGRLKAAEGRNIGLRVRRVRSNLDDAGAFACRAPFEPIEARFEAAGGELLKLLVGPLYEHEPAYGVRELLQNGVDAVRELEDVLDQESRYRGVDRVDGDADVVIRLVVGENGGGFLEVSDRGIGMTAGIIRDYFLRAGATYRRSDAWRRQHEDETGSPRVLRAGRFGVGLLAAFLLGDEIEVTTRHISAPRERALTFRCGLETEAVELRRTEASVGTTIRVRLKDNVIDRLLERVDAWDWYCLARPNVKRVVELESARNGLSAGTTILAQDFHVPSSGPSDAPETGCWRRLATDGLDGVWWSWRDLPALSCNGLAVRRASVHPVERLPLPRPAWSHDDFRCGALTLRVPSLALFDKRDAVQLNLQRTQAEGRDAAYEPALRRAVCRDFLGFLLARTPNSRAEGIAELSRWLVNLEPRWSCAKSLRLAWPGMRLVPVNQPGLVWPVFCEGGLSIASPHVLARLPYLRRAVRLVGPIPRLTGRDVEKYLTSLDAILGLGEAVVLQKPGYSDYDGQSWTAAWAVYHRMWSPAGHGLEWLTPRVAYGLADRYAELAVTGCLPRTAPRSAPLGNNGPYLHADAPEINEGAVQALAERFGAREFPPLEVWELAGPPETSDQPAAVAQTWLDILGQPIIPWDLDERQRGLAHAYDDLAEEIARWEPRGTRSDNAAVTEASRPRAGTCVSGRCGPSARERLD